MSDAGTSGRALDRYLRGLGALGAIAAVASLTQVDQLPTPFGVLCAAALVALGNLPIVHVRHGEDNHTFNWSEAAVVGGLVLLPAWWLAPVGAVVTAGWYAAAGRPAPKVAFNAATFAAGATLATAVSVAVLDAHGTGQEWAALGLATAVWFVWNLATVSVAVALSRGVGVVEVARSGLELAVIFAVANTSVAILVATAATSEPLVLFAVPPVVLQLAVAYRNTREVIGERDLWVSVQAVSEELQRADADSLPAVAAHAVDRLVGADLVELVTVDGERARRHRLADGNLQVDLGSVAELAGDVWGRATCDRVPFWLVRATASPAQRRWLESSGSTTSVVVPLEWGGAVHGLLRAGFRGRRTGTQRVESVLTTLATQLGSALSSHRHTAVLRHQAEHDDLTQLPNRKLLVQHLESRLGAGAGLAVLFFDLDEFKVVNDSLGHHVGDEVLLEAARRLRTHMRPQDLVARFGGDEFIVVCEDVEDPQAALDVARRLLDALGRAGSGGGPISASVGVVFAEEGTDADALLRDADAAMYQAKRGGPGSSCLFTAELRTQALNRLHLESDLRDALRRNELEVHYQPIVDLRTGEVRELEALARWHHPERGPVSPAAFVAVAEETGTIRLLGEFVLHRACADMRRWLDLGLATADQRVAVNLSRLQLDATLPTVVGDALARHGLPASALTLEVTESAFVDDPEGVASLERLRAIGVEVALDDFGTGYSSLSTLRDLPADSVKVDRSFVDRVPDDAQLRALVRGIVDLAHALDLRVVGEGVETEAQAEALAAAGCDRVQGWLHGRPASAAVTEALLGASRPLAAPLVADDEPVTPGLRLA